MGETVKLALRHHAELPPSLDGSRCTGGQGASLARDRGLPLLTTAGHLKGQRRSLEEDRGAEKRIRALALEKENEGGGDGKTFPCVASHPL